MASYNKRELEKKKQTKKLQKQKRKEERKANAPGGAFEDMIAYVDARGMITDTPPEAVAQEECNIEDIVISTPKKEQTDDMQMRGTVSHFNADKGYGFIKEQDTDREYFFHVSSVNHLVKEGHAVCFDLEKTPKGMNAVNIIEENIDNKHTNQN